MRRCLDRLTSVAELDDFLGQMLAAMTRQLGAVASTLRLRERATQIGAKLVIQAGLGSGTRIVVTVPISL